MKKEEEELLIWRFLDGDITRAEEQLIEDQLELDPNFRQRMADLRDLDLLLQKRKALLPSTRFAASVMEAIAKPIVSSPLISRKWFWRVAAGFLLIMFATGIGMNSLTIGTEGLTEASWILSMQNKSMTFATHPIFLLVAKVSSGVFSLFLLDRWFGKRYRIKPQKVRSGY